MGIIHTKYQYIHNPRTAMYHITPTKYHKIFISHERQCNLKFRTVCWSSEFYNKLYPKLRNCISVYTMEMDIVSHNICIANNCTCQRSISQTLKSSSNYCMITCHRSAEIHFHFTALCLNEILSTCLVSSSGIQQTQIYIDELARLLRLFWRIPISLYNHVNHHGPDS